MTHGIARWGTARLARRIAISVPYVGAIIALATVGFAIRRKGVLGGSLDTALNAVPYLGAAKNIVEIIRGDLFPDLPPPSRPPDPADLLGRQEIRPASLGISPDP